MRQAIASRTAERVALRRAAHQIFDEPRVFEDPLALRIVGTEATAALQADQVEAQKPSARSMRAFFAARSRYAEDELASSVRRGVRQCVILGAGLDTFGYRNPFSGVDLRVLEVDHPATQTWKRERLEKAGIEIPPQLAFVPINFEEQSLAAELGRAGFDASQPAFFSWLGVTPYLTRTAFDGTITFIAALPRNSEIVFDFVVDRRFLTPLELDALRRLESRLELAGEPFKLFFEPARLEQDLRHLGFTHIECLASVEINRRYFADRADALRILSGHGNLLSARM
jgi:methyltransferase (TIGR00027 family)